MKKNISRIFRLNSKKNSQNSNINMTDRKFRRRLKQFFKKHKVVLIALGSGLSLMAIITYYPAARKLLISKLNLLKYKVDNDSSLNDIDSIDLTDKQRRWKRKLALFIYVVGSGLILKTLSNKGGEIFFSKDQLQSDLDTTTNTEVPFAIAIRDNIIMAIILSVLSYVR